MSVEDGALRRGPCKAYGGESSGNTGTTQQRPRRDRQDAPPLYFVPSFTCFPPCLPQFETLVAGLILCAMPFSSRKGGRARRVREETNEKMDPTLLTQHIQTAIKASDTEFVDKYMQPR